MPSFSIIRSFDEKTKDILIILFLLILSVYLRPLPAINLMGRDETSYAFLAKHFLDGTFLDDYIFVAFHPFYSFVVALVGKLGINIELAGRIVSFIFSVLTVIPVYFIGKILFNTLTGFVAGFMTATFPHLIKWSVIVQAQAIYSFTLVMSFLFLILAIKREKYIFYIVSGIFLSLAYLSRAEAIGIFAGNIILLLLLSFKKQEKRKVLFIGLIVFIASFIIVASPYIYALKLKTGALKFTNKLYVQIRQAVIVHYELDYERLNFGGADLPKKDVLMLALFAYPEKLIEGIKNLPKYFGVFSILAVFFVFFIRIFRKISVSGLELFLPYLYVIIVLPFFFVAENYFIPYAPLVFVISGYGIAVFHSFFKEKQKILAVILPLFFISYENIFHFKIKNLLSKPSQEEQDIQTIVYSSYRDFGRGISPLIEPNARIMTRFNISAWYAGGEYVNFPLVSWEEFVKNIDNYKADYILIGPAEMSGRTDISMNLLKSTQENKKFRLVKSARMQGSFEFYLVKVEK